MSPSPRRALVLAALGVAGTAAAAHAQTETTVEVRELELPVVDLDLETASLDRSVRRVERDGDVRVTLAADVLFAFNSARLTRRARSRIAEAAREIRRAEPDTVSVEGHTDSKGSPSFNVRLSLRRAQAVRRALDRAVGGDVRVTASGRGESKPVAENQTKDGSDNPRGRARNRRVEIRFPGG